MSFAYGGARDGVASFPSPLPRLRRSQAPSSPALVVESSPAASSTVERCQLDKILEEQRLGLRHHGQFTVRRAGARRGCDDRDIVELKGTASRSTRCSPDRPGAGRGHRERGRIGRTRRDDASWIVPVGPGREPFKSKPRARRAWTPSSAILDFKALLGPGLRIASRYARSSATQLGSRTRRPAPVLRKRASADAAARRCRRRNGGAGQTCEVESCRDSSEESWICEQSFSGGRGAVALGRDAAFAARRWTGHQKPVAGLHRPSASARQIRTED